MLPISAGLPGALIALLHGSPLSDGKVTFAWNAAVGAAIGRATRVKLEHRVLIVETDSLQWSTEIRRSGSVILKRLQSLLGGEQVERIEVRRA